MKEQIKVKTKNYGKAYVKVFINSFSFITALAWNSAFQTTFERMSELNLIGPWVYALVITFICVCITKCTEHILDD
tara:strand:+ start:423 stop:650 length:228 start_codon:yes stop_codon:yes gene_type:complete